jgi:hypothetical protein
MKNKCIEISSVSPNIIQNGIDIDAIEKLKKHVVSTEECAERDKLVSIRGLTDLYRIREILNSRGGLNVPITFIYPFYERAYKCDLEKDFSRFDTDVGRLDRRGMYELLFQAQLTVSIPSSDSSPRSVYEAVFCGSPVCITNHPYYEALPDCMKKRIILIDVTRQNWFAEALEIAQVIKKKKYQPSEEALDVFDQKRAFKKVSELIENEL